ncbi:hypothetical protein [Cohnella nanjingensis]|uniref:Uncharacterized protein n=1 Tax=Cohnella nanjingensis TaxID=1387779 RepID=A0A7X0RQ51_9BACL|nr:hypothetical protein [Cohnella nanjingensis]MBB6671413.1 hypothetical protein [Cohnella nanjingensis]
MNAREIDAFVEEQKRSAVGQRLEMLRKDWGGTRKMLESVLLPVFKSFEGFVLEYELVSLSGMRIYVDAFYEPLGVAFEAEGYVVHGETITRERFDFEKMRIRTLGNRGYKYYPFSWDEMDKRPEACQRSVFELLGRAASMPSSGLFQLPVYEREILRFGLLRANGFSLGEASACLHAGEITARKIIRSLMAKQLVESSGNGSQRFHRYRLTASAYRYLA